MNRRSAAPGTELGPTYAPHRPVAAAYHTIQIGRCQTLPLPARSANGAACWSSRPTALHTHRALDMAGENPYYMVRYLRK
jgi:hypothetical protein